MDIQYRPFILEFYKKAIRSGAKSIIDYLKSETSLHTYIKGCEEQQGQSCLGFLIVSILGNQKELFGLYKELWIQDSTKTVADFKQLYEAILSSPSPCIESLKQVQRVETDCRFSQKPLPIRCSAGAMIALLKDEDLGKFLVDRMQIADLYEMLTSNQECLSAIIQSEKLLISVLDKCLEVDQQFDYKIGKQAIILTHQPTIQVLIDRKLDFTKREGLDCSLLFFAVLRAVATGNSQFLEGVVAQLPALDDSTIRILKAHLTETSKISSYQGVCQDILGLMTRKGMVTTTAVSGDLTSSTSNRGWWPFGGL